MRRPNNLPEQKFFDFMLTRAQITQGPLETPCYLWLGSKKKTGYGSIGFRRKIWRVSRVTWTLRFGEIPERTEVCHRCDNPACFNPEHLFLGSHGDNMRDAEKKKRVAHLKGEDHSMAKLTAADVIQIRAEYDPKLISRRKLAVKFNVSYSLVCMITRRQIWKHI